MMISRILIGLILMSVLALLPAVQKPVMAAVDCFTCHERAAFQKKVKHEPAEAGKCSTCHSHHVARYEGLLRREVPRLCYDCHSEMDGNHRQAVVHRPVREGECLACHDPHASDQAGLVKQRPPESCLSCHSELPSRFKFTHAPYAKGQCSSCHAAHESANRALLLKESDALCLSCHALQTVRQKHRNYPAEVKNCGTCHSPHGSDNPALIRNVLHDPYAAGCQDCHAGKDTPVGIDTCLQCHDEVGEQMSSSHNHLVRYGDNGCMACHSPHAGDDKRLLKGNERYVCSTCHLDTFQRYDAAASKHVTTDSCSDCHAPHGSNYPNMTKAPVNAICAPCHEKHSEFTHPIGEKVFDPRTLQMMTCTSCHSNKGSRYESHLRQDGHRDLCVQCHRDI